MNVNCERERQPMKFARLILGVTLPLALIAPNTWAQTAPDTAKSGPESVRTFSLTNISRPEDATEVTVALRNLLDPTDKIFLVPSQNAIIVRGTTEQLALAQRLLTDLDRLKKTYRLIYTIAEMDNGKRIGIQHFSMVVVSGGRTTLKQGSKVPVVTGTYNSGSSTSQSQFTYLDVGMAFDASLDEFVDGVRLRTKVEQSSVADSTMGAQDPIVRQTVLEGTSILAQGKPLILGSLDIPGSTRHLDVEVVLEAVR